MGKLIETLNENSFLVFLIIFGAIAHSVHQWKKARDEGVKFDVLDFIILLIIALFSGTVFAMVGIQTGAAGLQVGILGAIGSFLGIMGLNAISDKFLAKFNKENDDTKKD